MVETQKYFSKCPFCEGYLSTGKFQSTKRGTGSFKLICKSCNRTYEEIWEIKKTRFSMDKSNHKDVEKEEEIIKCPNCSSDNLSAGSSVMVNSERSLKRDVKCHDCHLDISETWRHSHTIINEDEVSLLANII